VPVSTPVSMPVDRPRSKRRPFPSVLFRLLFPSWAFFDAVHDVPILEARVGTEWRPVLHAPGRDAAAVLFHPAGTAHLALQSLVDRLAVECEHGTVDPVTHALVDALVARAVQAWRDVAPEPFDRWSWRVVVIDGANPADPAKRVLHESAERHS